MRLLPYIASYIFFLLPLATYAQYKQHYQLRDYYTARAIGNERIYQRIYIGAGKHIMNGNASLRYTGPNSTGQFMDSTYTRKIHAKNTLVLHVGTFLPIALISDQSAFAFNIEMLFSYGDLAYDSIQIQDKVYKEPVPNIIIGMPVSFDFKSGNEVSLSKKQKHSFCIGGGVLLGSSSASIVTNNSTVPITTIPFIKLEAGIFAGLAFKLRGTAYLRRALKVDKDFYNVFSYDQINVKMNSGYGYMISLIVSPFSYGWGAEDWR